MRGQRTGLTGEKLLSARLWGIVPHLYKEREPWCKHGRVDEVQQGGNRTAPRQRPRRTHASSRTPSAAPQPRRSAPELVYGAARPGQGAQDGIGYDRWGVLGRRPWEEETREEPAVGLHAQLYFAAPYEEMRLRKP